MSRTGAYAQRLRFTWGMRHSTHTRLPHGSAKGTRLPHGSAKGAAKIGSVLGALQRMGFVKTADGGHSFSLRRGACRSFSVSRRLACAGGRW